MRAHFHADPVGRPVLDLRQAAARRRPDLSDLPDLTDEERAMAARTWRARMVNEHISAQVFASLVPQLMRAAVPPDLLASVPKMVSDELRHAEQCAGVVLALGHAPVAPLPEILTVPEHEDVGPLEGALRNIISVCCMSETVAVSVIRAEQVELEGTALGEVLETILADEINHARFGWGFLGQCVKLLDDDARARLSRYLVPALRHQIEFEVPKLPVNIGLRSEIAMAGVCDGGLARELFYDTIETVIVPQLETAGLDAHIAWAEAQATARPIEA
jgi:hypothetical protein